MLLGVNFLRMRYAPCIGRLFFPNPLNCRTLSVLMSFRFVARAQSQTRAATQVRLSTD